LPLNFATVSESSPGKLAGITMKGTDGKPATLVVINTSGYYMLWTIPLVSGNLDWCEGRKSIKGGFRLFRDQVCLKDLQHALTKIAESRGCDFVDVHFHDSDTSYAGPSYEGIVGALLGNSTMSVSAVLVPRSSAKKEVAK